MAKVTVVNHLIRTGVVLHFLKGQQMEGVVLHFFLILGHLIRTGVVLHFNFFSIFFRFFFDFVIKFKRTPWTGLVLSTNLKQESV